MAKYNYSVTVTVDEPLSRRDFQDLTESVERTVTGTGGKWDPEDFSGEVSEVSASVDAVGEEL